MHLEVIKGLGGLSPPGMVSVGLMTTTMTEILLTLHKTKQTSNFKFIKLKHFISPTFLDRRVNAPGGAVV